ncbi:MAG: hypothetical protein J7M10_05655 [Candidatus Cloacimonetes bacterium]|nr:hypothetical protein [Candidatus Cloacimonadota bacterium]
MKAFRFSILLTIFLIIHSWVIADNYSENATIKSQDAEIIHHGMYAGTSLDLGLGLTRTITYSLGYVKKQVSKNTSIYLKGTYTENIKIGYLVFEKIFHKERGLFFWGYYFGGGYVKWEYRTFSFTSKGENEKLESWMPFIGLKFGLRFKVFHTTYLNISTEILSLKYPWSFLTISIQ